MRSAKVGDGGGGALPGGGKGTRGGRWGGRRGGPGLVAGVTGACRNKVDPSPHRAPNCPRKKYSGIKVQKVVGIKSKPHKKLLP